MSDTTIEPKNKRSRRNLQLIATFAEGYAVGWFFAVGECCKDALDIKYTPRVEPLLKDGQEQYEIIEVKGKAKKRLITEEVWRWTQGPFYNFQQGFIFYDSPLGYLTWAEALKHIKLTCHIIKATPNTLDKNGLFADGYVNFALSQPNAEKTSLEIINYYDSTQNELILFLKTGQLKDAASSIQELEKEQWAI